jgi:hypothetical protein
MKNVKLVIAILSIISVIFTSCGGGNAIEKKQAELEKLKAQQADLAIKVKRLKTK